MNAVNLGILIGAIYTICAIPFAMSVGRMLKKRRQQMEFEQ
jgi:hypothetical protein